MVASEENVTLLKQKQFSLVCHKQKYWCVHGMKVYSARPKFGTVGRTGNNNNNNSDDDDTIYYASLHI